MLIYKCQLFPYIPVGLREYKPMLMPDTPHMYQFSCKPNKNNRKQRASRFGMCQDPLPITSCLCFITRYKLWCEIFNGFHFKTHFIVNGLYFDRLWAFLGKIYPLKHTTKKVSCSQQPKYVFISYIKQSQNVSICLYIPQQILKKDITTAKCLNNMDLD